MDIPTLVSVLKSANEAYHTSGELLMSDDDYDRGLAELKKRDPKNPFLAVVGAGEKSKTVALPHIMGSLDKIRFGEGTLDKWKKKMGGQRYVVSEKLDGISCLYVRKTIGSKVQEKLYLRGDGVKGVDVSHLIPKIFAKGPVLDIDCSIRGELVLPISSTPEGSIGRSLINGWMHGSKTTAENMGKIHFVGYHVYSTTMDRKTQLEWLTQKGMRVPWSCAVSGAMMTEDSMRELLVTRRRVSDYPLDGIVIGVNAVPLDLEEGKMNPRDSIAFKASLDEQKEETTVIQVEWNLSRQGFLIPRIQIEPVVIGGAKIQWLSAHNAAHIDGLGIGPGARIIVRRSGDVIPTLDTVLQKVGPAMPPAETWSWDATRTHAVVKNDGSAASSSVEASAVALVHALQTLEIDGMGAGIVAKLVEGGITCVKGIIDATPDTLSKLIGPGRGPALQEGLKNALATAPLMKILIASNLMPRGVGERKLKVLFDVDADPARWTKDMKVAGWSQGSLEGLLAVLPAAMKWNPVKRGVVTAAQASAPVTQETRSVVFTGGRDKVLEGMLGQYGWTVDPAITKKTTVLVVADDAAEGSAESGKVKKARASGIRILKMSEFKAMVLSKDH